MKDKFLLLSNNLVKHELIRGSFYMFLGFISGSFLAFVLNIFLVRSLTTTDYGIYASLLSIITLAGVLVQSFQPIIVRFATGYFAKNQIGYAQTLYFKSGKLLLIFSVSIFIIFFIFLNQISEYLHLKNNSYVIFVGFVVASQYIGIINTSFLQSLLKFKIISLFAGIGGFARLASGVLLVFFGFNVFGALFAIFLSFFVPFILGFIPLRFLFSKVKKIEKIEISSKELISYAIPTTIAVLSFVSLTSTDVLLVRHFFNEEDAGMYGALSLVGKVIFYFTGPISVAMFPLLIKKHTKGESVNTLFYAALLLVLCPSLAITFFYFIFPSVSINFFLGNSYIKIAPYLGMFGIYITVFSVVSLCVNFFLSLKKTKIFIPVLIVALMQVSLISLFHSSFFQVIGISLSLSVVLLLVLLVYYLYLFYDFKKIKEAIIFTNNPKN